MERTPSSFQILRPTLVAFFALGAMAASSSDPGTLNQSVNTAAPAAARPTDGRSETEVTCGIACRYHRANDNLTMQALYLVTKIGKIDEAYQKDSSSSEARTALGAFCRSDSEDLDVCFNRYKDFQRVALLNIRQSIGKNEDTIARLTTGRKADGTVDGTVLAFDSGEAKTTPYLPDVPTLSELEQSYIQGRLKPAGSKYSSAEIQKWSQDLIISNPKAKFIEFNKETVVGNPYQQEKTSYSLRMEKRDGSGAPAGPDAEAIRLYEKSVKTIQDYSTDKTIGGETKVIAPSKSLKKDDKISYDAFIQSRSVVNSKIDGDVNRADQDDADRKLASDKTTGKNKDPKEKSSLPLATAGNAAAVLNPVTNSGDGISRDVRVTTGTSAIRAPSGIKTYGEDEKVQRPADMKNSRYIKYDINDMLKDIDSATMESK